MFALLMGAEALIVVGMVAVSAWGWKHPSPETRTRARSGPTGIDWTMSKTTALLLHPIVGAFILLATVALRGSPNRENIAGLGIPVMAVFLAAHWHSIRRAAR